MTGKYIHGYRRFMVALLLFSILATISYAQPEGFLDVEKGPSERKETTAASTLEAVAGNITSLNLIGETVTSTWQGYYGNITATITLDPADGNTLYDWNLTSPEGEIYASPAPVDFSYGNIGCLNYTENLAGMETSLGLDSDDPDGVNETFSEHLSHDAFFAGTNKIERDSCPAVNLYNSSGESTEGIFQEVLLYDHSSGAPVYTALLEQDRSGFTDSLVDFQMIVGEDGHQGDSSTTTYYFYAELE